MINVTKTFLPEFEEYTSILRRAWDKHWLTNNGALAQELEVKLQQYFGVNHLLFSGNGTIVLQMALKALGITKEVITTPFSYVATTTALLWEGCKPVFVDIDPANFCIDPGKIEAAITKNTQAILATHVYGLPCDVEAIEKIAQKHGLKVIYDGAHAFGTEYLGKQLLSYGDISTCSFHATKLFHTVEGGCIICHDDDLLRKLMLYRSFGHVGDEYFSIGINGKNSEFHAAMGLANFPYIPRILARRKEIHHQYIDLLQDSNLAFIQFDAQKIIYNYAYFPVLFATEKDLLNARDMLAQEQINTRRYFYPSLNTLPYLKDKSSCPVSEQISRRVLCLPMYPDLENDQIKRISSIVLKVLKG
jgi:dTDP-4-amino-4,6-dideoxygalactose transaminase